MGRRALKVCSTAGCPELVESGRCAECVRRAETRRGSSAQRGYGSRWQRKRKAYLNDHPYCEQRGCYALATDVNHVDGLGPKGPRGFDNANLEALCHSHHSQHTAQAQPGGWNIR